MLSGIKNWKTVLVLSLIVTIGLIISLRAANVTHGPLAISETLTLDTASREFQRPGLFISYVNETVESHYSGDIAVDQSITLCAFVDPDYDYGGSASLEARFNVTAQVNGGFIEALNLTLEGGYESARIDESRYIMDMSGLLVSSSSADFERKVFVQLSGVHCPKNVSFCLPFSWVLYSPYTQAQQLDVTSEITYYNGTVYKKVIQPFQLKLTPNNNRNIETATEINPGTYTQQCVGGEDSTNFYKIHLNQGQTANVQVNCTPDLDQGMRPLFRVYVYDPQGNVVISGDSQDLSATPKEVQFQATSVGYWYIEVRAAPGTGGFYSLTVDV
jgi:hypothetical protein